MTTQHIETLIIGAGQAGLATGYHLKQLGREFLILDGNERVGDNWRCHWDSLRLFTPAKYDGLPGLPFPGRPVVVSRQGQRRRLPRDLRHRDGPAGAAADPGRPAQGTAGRRLHRAPRCPNDHLRQRRGGHRDPRAHSARARARGRRWPRPSGSCTPPSTSAPPSSATGPRSWSGHRTAAARSPTRSPSTCRRRCAVATPGTSRSPPARDGTGSSPR